MESLLRLSGKWLLSSDLLSLSRHYEGWICADKPTKGLLGDDDEATDLATLEKRLAEKHQQSKHESLASQASQSNPTSPSQATSGHDGVDSTPQSALTSPEPTKEREFRRDHSPPSDGKNEEEVAALSEMMCSLVTNQQGETRYIGEHRRNLSTSGADWYLCNRIIFWFLYIFAEGYSVGE